MISEVRSFAANDRKFGRVNIREIEQTGTHIFPIYGFIVITARRFWKLAPGL
jgi:hypothetical protein